MNKRYATAMIMAGLLSAAPAHAEDGTYTAPEISVVGISPVLGAGTDIAKIPANIKVIDPARDKDRAPQSAADLLNDKLGSVSAADYQGNPLQPSLSFRGFSASPTLGEPQGLAVYQNGMRVNEAFGDLVNWDMTPSFAIDKIQVLPGSNPVFGLNALGGAVAMKMKDGFSFQGSDGELGGGSFGRARKMMETGRQMDNLAYYAGVATQTDGGWRQHSPSNLVQGYGDLSARKGNLDLGMGLTLGASSLSGLGTTPVELLDHSRDAVFTSPDLTQNALGALELRSNYQLSDATALQSSLYYRHLRSATHNGDASGFSACGADPTTLCDNDGNTLTDRNGGTVSSALGGNGVINNTLTTSDSAGVTGQISHDGQLFGHKNSLLAGLSSDQGWSKYKTNSELASLTDLRAANSDGLYLGGSAYNVGLGAHNGYYGAYVSDSLDLADHWTLTGAGRLNAATIHLHDDLGSGLDGTHHYQRLNPALGLTWQAAPKLTTYVSYSEANRVPTAAELSCADSSQPCRVPNAFVSDPGLHQVVSHTVELGARGDGQLGEAKANWSLAGYATRNSDDIIFVSSGPTLGGGYFSNAGSTLRQGIEADGDLALGDWTLSASYGLTRAVFDSAMTLHSPNNSSADANGDIHVSPGNRLPGIPEQSLKLGAAYAVTADWTIAADSQISSDRVLRGDESNSMKKLPGYALFNAGTSYRLSPGWELFLRVRNIFDKHYATAGTLGDPTSVFSGFTDTRFLSEGEPRSLWAGTRISF